MTKEKIITAALDMYLQYGVKSVTMDDLTRELGVSKKTLYKYVENKDDLVYRAMQTYFDEERKFVNENFTEKSNAIDDLFGISEFLSGYLTKLNPTVKYDLQKYHPETWGLFEEYKNEFIYSVIFQNLEKGIRQGLYRDDIDLSIIATLYVDRCEIVIDPSAFPPDEFSMLDVMNEMQIYHIRGIATRFGVKYLNNKLKELQDEEA